MARSHEKSMLCVSVQDLWKQMSVAWELGHAVDVKHVSLQCSKWILFWDLFGTCMGVGVGWGGQPRKTALARVSNRLKSWQHSKGRFLTLELSSLGGQWAVSSRPWRWTGQGQVNSSLQELMLRVDLQCSQCCQVPHGPYPKSPETEAG